MSEDKYSNLPEDIAEDARKTDEAMEKSRKLDGLEGKIISARVADGRAYYEVKRVDEDLVYIEHRPDLGIDTWKLPIIQNGTWIHKESVKRAVERQENIEKIFGESE